MGPEYCTGKVPVIFTCLFYSHPSMGNINLIIRQGILKLEMLNNISKTKLLINEPFCNCANVYVTPNTFYSCQYHSMIKLIYVLIFSSSKIDTKRSCCKAPHMKPEFIEHTKAKDAMVHLKDIRNLIEEIGKMKACMHKQFYKVQVTKSLIITQI